MSRKEEKLQERLRNDDKKALKEVYLLYKSDFLNFFRSRGSATADLEDIYHESVVVLYQSFVVKQLELRTASIKSYLIGIGKNKLRQLYKEESKLSFVDSEAEEVQLGGLLPEQDISEERKQLLARAYRGLGEKCKELIKLFYYRGFSIKEMVETTSYKDENTVKSYKSRCLKKLKESIRVSYV